MYVCTYVRFFGGGRGELNRFRPQQNPSLLLYRTAFCRALSKPGIHESPFACSFRPVTIGVTIYRFVRLLTAYLLSVYHRRSFARCANDGRPKKTIFPFRRLFSSVPQKSADGRMWVDRGGWSGDNDKIGGGFPHRSVSNFDLKKITTLHRISKLVLICLNSRN